MNPYAVSLNWSFQEVSLSSTTATYVGNTYVTQTPAHLRYTHTCTPTLHTHLHTHVTHTPAHPRYTHTCTPMLHTHLHTHVTHTPAHPRYTHTCTPTLHRPMCIPFPQSHSPCPATSGPCSQLDPSIAAYWSARQSPDQNYVAAHKWVWPGYNVPHPPALCPDR